MYSTEIWVTYLCYVQLLEQPQYCLPIIDWKNLITNIVIIEIAEATNVEIILFSCIAALDKSHCLNGRLKESLPKAFVSEEPHERTLKDTLKKSLTSCGMNHRLGIGCGCQKTTLAAKIAKITSLLVKEKTHCHKICRAKTELTISQFFHSSHFVPNSSVTGRI